MKETFQKNLLSVGVIAIAVTFVNCKSIKQAIVGSLAL